MKCELFGEERIRLAAGNRREDGDLIISGNGCFQTLSQFTVMTIDHYSYMWAQRIAVKNRRSQKLIIITNTLQRFT